MTKADIALAHSQQVVGMLLSTMPSAERMLVYNLGATVWIMLASRLPFLLFQRQV